MSKNVGVFWLINVHSRFKLSNVRWIPLFWTPVSITVYFYADLWSRNIDTKCLSARGVFRGRGRLGTPPPQDFQNLKRKSTVTHHGNRKRDKEEDVKRRNISFLELSWPRKEPPPLLFPPSYISSSPFLPFFIIKYVSMTFWVLFFWSNVCLEKGSNQLIVTLHIYTINLSLCSVHNSWSKPFSRHTL